MAEGGLVGKVRRAAAYFRAHPRLTRAIQLLLVAATLALCAWAIVDQWHKAWPRLENANLGYLALGFATVAAYYLVFILGWIRMLEAWDIHVPYRVALQAEMVSMLAKYLPGGVWTPAARTVALRRAAGVTETPTVLASILVEAGLSAISGVIVFVVSLAWVRDVHAPLWALVAFAVLLASALHPRVFRPLAEKLLRPFGADRLEPLPFSLTITLLLFYCATWVIGGIAVYFMLRSLGSNPGLSTIPFLGGVSAVGAIVAVLTVFLPSGLGAREASMYGLLLAVTTSGPALGVTLLNRLAITLVELLLFGTGLASWRARPHEELAPDS
jgi:glycosyltransferase 2 family protein